MIKKLFVTAVLLVPGFAYGGNPSADLSVQVVPARTGTCGTIMGQAGTDAAAAGFTTVALCNDFTTAIPNSVGTGLPSGWLNCNGDTIDTNAVWNKSASQIVPCAAIQQVTDPTYGNLTLDIDFNSSYVQSGLGWPGSMAELITVPAIDSSTNSNPAHSFSNAYYEITYRLQPVPGQFTGGTQGFWQFFCCNTGDTFVDNEIFEDWSTWSQNRDFGFNYWTNGVGSTGADVHNIPATDPTTYHTVAGMVTSNATAFSQCSYFDGVRHQCATGTYQAGQSGAQRRNLIIWNGTSCSYDPTITSCVGSFSDVHMYIESIKVVTCPAEPTGGSCIGTNFNGNFYTP
jgi:hypothetical protein